MDNIKMSLTIGLLGRKSSRLELRNDSVNYDVTQVINMTNEAYKYMTSDARPEWCTQNWKVLGKKQRLKLHMERTAEAFNGVMISYEVFPD